MKKQDKAEVYLTIAAIILLLFTAMIEPIISASLAIIILILFVIYKFIKK